MAKTRTKSKEIRLLNDLPLVMPIKQRLRADDNDEAGGGGASVSQIIPGGANVGR